MDEQEMIKKMGLPSWFTPEMLRPGVPITPPANATETTIFDDAGMHEKWPGAWKRKPNPNPIHKKWYEFWK